MEALTLSAIQWAARSRDVAAGATCPYCGTSQDLVVHHLRPRIYGGTDARANLVAVCRRHHPRAEMASRVAAKRAGWPLVYPNGPPSRSTASLFEMLRGEAPRPRSTVKTRAF